MTMTVRELLVSKKISMRDVDYIAIVSDDGIVLNSADQQPVWFGMHQLSEEFMDKEVAAFSVTECDDVFSEWESGPLKNHTFENLLIARLSKIKAKLKKTKLSEKQVFELKSRLFAIEEYLDQIKTV